MPFTVLLQPHSSDAALSLPPAFLRDHIDLLLTATHIDAAYKYKELDRYARFLWGDTRRLHALQLPGLRLTVLPRPGWQELCRTDILQAARDRAARIAAALAPLLDALPDGYRLIVPRGQAHPDHYATALGAAPWATHTYREWPSSALTAETTDPFWRRRVLALAGTLSGVFDEQDGPALYCGRYGAEARACFDDTFVSQAGGYRTLDGQRHEDFECRIEELGG